MRVAVKKSYIFRVLGAFIVASFYRMVFLGQDGAFGFPLLYVSLSPAPERWAFHQPLFLDALVGLVFDLVFFSVALYVLENWVRHVWRFIRWTRNIVAAAHISLLMFSTLAIISTAIPLITHYNFGGFPCYQESWGFPYAYKYMVHCDLVLPGGPPLITSWWLLGVDIVLLFWLFLILSSKMLNWRQHHKGPEGAAHEKITRNHQGRLLESFVLLCKEAANNPLRFVIKLLKIMFLIFVAIPLIFNLGNLHDLESVVDLVRAMTTSMFSVLSTWWTMTMLYLFIFGIFKLPKIVLKKIRGQRA